jgi:hypothetical protein
MQEPQLSPAQISSTAPPVARATPMSTFLRSHAAHLDMIANYGDLLDEAIFTRPPIGCDAKNSKFLKQQCRLLRSTDAYKTLAVIWKESRFVDDEDLARAGLSREYQGRDLTSYSLATDFSRTAKQVAKLNSRIRSVGLAASTYGLIDRQLVHSTKVILSGTEVLHSFMSELGAKNSLVMTRFVPLLNSDLQPKLDGR